MTQQNQIGVIVGNTWRRVDFWNLGVFEDLILNTLKIIFNIKNNSKNNLCDHMDVYYICVKFGDEITKHVSYTKMTKWWFPNSE